MYLSLSHHHPLLFLLLWNLTTTTNGDDKNIIHHSGGMPPKFLVQFRDSDHVTSENNPRVFFDIEIGGKKAGRIQMELFSTITPKTAENFRAL